MTSTNIACLIEDVNLSQLLFDELVAPPGFEPGSRRSERPVMPLHYGAMSNWWPGWESNPQIHCSLETAALPNCVPGLKTNVPFTIDMMKGTRSHGHVTRFSAADEHVAAHVMNARTAHDLVNKVSHAVTTTTMTHSVNLALVNDLVSAHILSCHRSSPCFDF